MIENWQDTAFGSDFGGDFLTFIEKISEKELSIELIYQQSDIKKYFDDPASLELRTDNNVNFTHSKYQEYIHFEDFVIGLSAMIIESGVNGQLDLTKVDGTKTLTFQFTKDEISPIYHALQNIYTTPDKYVLFEMCMEEERKETLADIQEMITAFGQLV